MKNIGKLFGIAAVVALIGLSLIACSNPSGSDSGDPGGKNSPAVISISSIPGVTPPAYQEHPVTAIHETTQYTGTVTWNPSPETFAANTVYTATIILTAKTGYTLQGVAANFFTVAGGTSENNSANSGVVTEVFPATGSAPPAKISIASITGLTAPKTGETPVTDIDDTAHFTGTVTWSPSDSAFNASTVYTATIHLTAKPGYTLQGVAANFFTVTGVTATNAANSGVVSVVFPATKTEPPILYALVPGNGATVPIDATNVQTYPVPMVVQLDKPATSDTDIIVISDNAVLQVVGGKVTIPKGQTESPILFNTGHSPTSGVTVTASLGTISLTAKVDVKEYFYPTAMMLMPAELTVAPGGSCVMTVMIDQPAPPEGITVTLNASSGVTVPSAVVISANTNNTTFLLQGIYEIGATVTAYTTVPEGTITSNSADVEVKIFYPTAMTLTPSAVNIAPGGTCEMLIKIDCPAPPGGISALLITDAGITVPAEVKIPANTDNATFTLNAGTTATTATVKATLTVPAGTVISNTATIKIGN